MEDLKQKPLHAIGLSFTCLVFRSKDFKDLQTWQTGVERHLMRLEPDVKLPWQEPLWNPEQCPMMWKL